MSQTYTCFREPITVAIIFTPQKFLKLLGHVQNEIPMAHQYRGQSTRPSPCERLNYGEGSGHETTSCQWRVHSGFMTQQVAQLAQHVVMQSCMVVVLLLAFIYHHLLFTRVFSTCTTSAGAIYVCCKWECMDGWRRAIYQSWLKKMFLPATSNLCETGPVVATSVWSPPFSHKHPTYIYLQREQSTSNASAVQHH